MGATAAGVGQQPRLVPEERRRAGGSSDGDFFVVFFSIDNTVGS